VTRTLEKSRQLVDMQMIEPKTAQRIFGKLQ